MLAGLPENGVKLSGDLWSLSANADGILDFTVPAATIANVAIAAQRGLVHIIGTTGLSSSDDAVIKTVTGRAIVVKSGNMSLGVNLLAALVKRVAQSLDEGFDIEVLEMHHKAKIDAPSGTALMLGEAAAAGRGVSLETHSARGRDGITGARRPGDIGFASLRGGTVTGDHSVIFAGAMERITLSHHAEDRMMFAQGAVKAALWARQQKPGMYSMMDVLGLEGFLKLFSPPHTLRGRRGEESALALVRLLQRFAGHLGRLRQFHQIEQRRREIRQPAIRQ